MVSVTGSDRARGRATLDISTCRSRRGRRRKRRSRKFGEGSTVRNGILSVATALLQSCCFGLPVPSHASRRCTMGREVLPADLIVPPCQYRAIISASIETAGTRRGRSVSSLPTAPGPTWLIITWPQASSAIRFRPIRSRRIGTSTSGLTTTTPFTSTLGDHRLRLVRYA